MLSHATAIGVPSLVSTQLNVPLVRSSVRIPYEIDAPDSRTALSAGPLWRTISGAFVSRRNVTAFGTATLPALSEAVTRYVCEPSASAGNVYGVAHATAVSLST